MHPKRTEEHRYWQTLLSCVALQHDDQGDLVFSTVQLGTARQSGKSWSLREISMWRLEQGDRWGELQTVVHAAAKLSQAEAVWSPAARWASQQHAPLRDAPTRQPVLFDFTASGLPGVGRRLYDVRRANGSAMIVRREDDSAWIPQAAGDQLGVSLSVSMGLVDEAWDVPRDHVDNGLVPTMAEARSSQLWIVSTSGRPKTGEVSDLYPVYRANALEQLRDPRDHLIVEWSADPMADPGDPHTWRQASPHWSEQRRQVLEREWAKAQKSEKALDVFRRQWLNIWPLAHSVSAWIPNELVSACARGVVVAAGRIAAVEQRPDSESCSAVFGGVGGAEVLVGRRMDEVDAWLRARNPELVLCHQAVANQLPAGYPIRVVKSGEVSAGVSVLAEVVRSGALTFDHADQVLPQFADVVVIPGEQGPRIAAQRSRGDVSVVKALSWLVWWERHAALEVPGVF
jgi:hypothetical protein